MTDAISKIAIGSDHAGFEYKEKIKAHLESRGFEVKDFGTDSNESCDYPDFIRPTAEAVASGQCQAGIVLGGSGNGEAIVANKVKGVRCGVCWSLESAQLTKEHNNANVIALGQRLVAEEMVLKVVDKWLDAEFQGGRHLNRINKIKID